MISILRTNSDNKDFIELVRHLDADLARRDGEDHAFFAQYNKVDMIKHVVVAFENEIPVSCGGIKQFDNNTMEVKRMYTRPDYRGKGLASKILSELEKWTFELGYQKCILETGIKQPEAIRLYEKNNYQLIPNYEPYVNVETSRCFMKNLYPVIE